MQMEQEVFILADISSSDGCAMQLISQEEGSESQSMSFVCSFHGYSTPVMEEHTKLIDWLSEPSS